MKREFHLGVIVAVSGRGSRRPGGARYPATPMADDAQWAIPANNYIATSLQHAEQITPRTT